MLDLKEDHAVNPRILAVDVIENRFCPTQPNLSMLVRHHAHEATAASTGLYHGVLRDADICISHHVQNAVVEKIDHDHCW